MTFEHRTVRNRRASTAQVLYEDDAIVVINKPAPLLTIPDHFDRTLPNLAEMLRETYGEIFIVHRLDRDTSGIVVFAKTEAAHRQLSRQFEAHTVRKTYLALAEGCLKEEEGVVRHPVADDPANPGRSRIDERHGKESETAYRVIERFTNATLLEATPRTGRLHQIRVHLRSMGHPLLLDPVYGFHEAVFLSQMKHNYKLTAESEAPLMSRLSLHAATLSMVHPITGEPVTFEAPAPKDFEGLLKQLRKFQRIDWSRKPASLLSLRRGNRQRSRETEEEF